MLRENSPKALLSLRACVARRGGCAAEWEARESRASIVESRQTRTTSALIEVVMILATQVVVPSLPALA